VATDAVSKLKPEQMEMLMTTMDKLNLKPNELQGLMEKFSELMPKDKSGKGMELAVHAVEKLGPERLKPIVEFAKRLSPGDAQLMKSASKFVPSRNPEEMIEQGAKMTPRQIQAKLNEVRTLLHYYHMLRSILG
jgi:hypothetical protein